jgi:hypothetical protein
VSTKAFNEARMDERLACARIAAKECPCKLPFEQCHVAQEILLRREEETK